MLCSCLPLLHPPFLKAQLNKQNYKYAAACSISLGFQRKRLKHIYWVWRLTWVEGVTAWMAPKINVMVIIAFMA